MFTFIFSLLALHEPLYVYHNTKLFLTFEFYSIFQDVSSMYFQTAKLQLQYNTVLLPPVNSVRFRYWCVQQILLEIDFLKSDFFILLLQLFCYVQRNNFYLKFGNAKLKFRRGNHLYAMETLAIFLSHSSQYLDSRSNCV